MFRVDESVVARLTPEGLGQLAHVDAPASFVRDGYVVVPTGLAETFCADVLECLSGATLISVEKRSRAGITRFLTLNGRELCEQVPGLESFYQGFAPLISHVLGTACHPLDNLRVGLSLNYTLPGGGFARHFDRNYATVSLYLNTVEQGELEIWPNIVSPMLDRLGRWKLPVALRLTHLRRGIPIPPRRGTLVVFSRRTVHGVAPVAGARARVSIIMAYDRSDASFVQADDYYGLGAERVVLTDPRV